VAHRVAQVVEAHGGNNEPARAFVGAALSGRPSGIDAETKRVEE
jgi:hypothetical protein